MNRYIFILVQVILIAVVLGCSSRIYDSSPGHSPLKINIDMSDASPKLLALISEYRVIVLDVNENKVVANEPLIFNNSTFFVEGQIDSLPANTELLFTAEARDSRLGVIFRGTATATLVSDQVNDVFINLSPVVPLIKSTPRYTRVQGSDLSTHTFDIKVFNVDSLYGISFRLYYDPTYILFAGARLDTSQDPAVIFFETDVADSTGFYKAITVTHSVAGTPIVAPDSDAVLTNVDFSLETAFITPETTFINIVPTGLTLTDQSTLPPTILYIDESVIEIAP